MVDEMLDLCSTHGLEEFNVTFAVRACDAVESEKQMNRLLDQSKLWSLTIWNGREGVSASHHAVMQRLFNGNRVFYDIYAPGQCPHVHH